MTRNIQSTAIHAMADAIQARMIGINLNMQESFMHESIGTVCGALISSRRELQKILVMIDGALAV